jgi:hypothetical protein
MLAVLKKRGGLGWCIGKPKCTGKVPLSGVKSPENSLKSMVPPECQYYYYRYGVDNHVEHKAYLGPPDILEMSMSLVW